ncbi:MAG: hypothetical protein AAFO82_13635, partial [Bacteroidota bacterium]
LTTIANELRETEKNFKNLSAQEIDKVKANALLNVFFHKDDLEELLDQPGCVALRFYPAFDDNDKPSLLAVAINTKGDDMVKKFDSSRTEEDKCFISRGVLREARNIPVVDGDRMIRRIGNMIEAAGNEAVAREQAFPFANPNSGRGGSFAKAVFESSVIRGMLTDDVKGVRFYTTKIEYNDDDLKYKTLAAAKVNNDDMENNVVMSALPCPPNCAGGGYAGNGIG